MLVLEQTRHRLRAPDRRPPGGAGGFVSSVATGKKKVAKVPKGVLGLGFGVRVLLPFGLLSRLFLSDFGSRLRGSL